MQCSGHKSERLATAEQEGSQRPTQASSNCFMSLHKKCKRTRRRSIRQALNFFHLASHHAKCAMQVRWWSPIFTKPKVTCLSDDTKRCWNTYFPSRQEAHFFFVADPWNFHSMPPLCTNVMDTSSGHFLHARRTAPVLYRLARLLCDKKCRRPN